MRLKLTAGLLNLALTLETGGHNLPGSVRVKKDTYQLAGLTFNTEI